jgi:hypothetical protein
MIYAFIQETKSKNNSISLRSTADHVTLCRRKKKQE